MSERLSEEQLEAMGVLVAECVMNGQVAIADGVSRIVAELRSLRLSDEERAALRWAVDRADSASRSTVHGDFHNEGLRATIASARKALARLTGGEP